MVQSTHTLTHIKYIQKEHIYILLGVCFSVHSQLIHLCMHVVHPGLTVVGLCCSLRDISTCLNLLTNSNSSDTSGGHKPIR